METLPMRAIGPAGALARIVAGAVALALATTNGIQWWDAALGLLTIPLIVTLGHAWLVHQYPNALRAIGMAGACATALIFAPLLIVPFTRDGTLLWLGASLLLAAWRGYAGCEVLAISNWLLERDDQVGCIVCSPLDALEERISGRRIVDSPR